MKMGMVSTLILAMLVLNAYSDNGKTSPVVKVIYFKSVDVSRPTEAELDFYRDVMLDAQNYFRSEMKRHGFEPKTFLVDLTPEDKVNIPIVSSRGNLRDYTSIALIEADLPNEYRLMIGDHNNILVIFLSGAFEFDGLWGVEFWSCGANNQCIHRVVIPTKRTNVVLGLTAHELGHSFGLAHNSVEHSLMYPTTIDWGAGPQVPGGLLSQEVKILNRNPYFVGPDNSEDTEINEDSVALTFSYNTSDSLAPINGLQDWDGWEGGIWEKTPDGFTSNKPHVDYRNSPNMNSWNHWMYSHAPSKIIYDISDKVYTKFSSYLDMPSCGGAVSIEVIVYADDAEIYRSGVLRVNNRNRSIAFDIPEGTEILTIEVDDVGRNACDHFVFGNPRLFYEIPSDIQDFVGPGNSEDTEINEDSVALTFSYDTSDSLAPINGLQDWDGWEAGVWEKTPDGISPPKPQPYNNFPNMNTWDHWMYSHAPSKIIYNISDRAYIRFEGYFDSLTNCGNTPSMQIIVSADDDEIYRTGKLGAGNRNTYLTFDIPASTSTLMIEVDDVGRNTCDHFILGNPKLFYELLPDIQVDVNSDGKIDLVDLVIVASNFGAVIKGEIHPNPDVNRDGVVDREDIILVVDALDASGTSVEDVGAAPELLASIESGEFFRQSRLLANYPNPSNPETWIPYYLSTSADVNVQIYNIDGRLIRTLLLGYQYEGFYGDRSRAAYWDGCNDVGERVASGIYFYTLSAGDFTATRKMLIRK